MRRKLLLGSIVLGCTAALALPTALAQNNVSRPLALVSSYLDCTGPAHWRLSIDHDNRSVAMANDTGGRWTFPVQMTGEVITWRSNVSAYVLDRFSLKLVATRIGGGGYIEVQCRTTTRPPGRKV